MSLEGRSNHARANSFPKFHHCSRAGLHDGLPPQEPVGGEIVGRLRARAKTQLGDGAGWRTLG